MIRDDNARGSRRRDKVDPFGGGNVHDSQKLGELVPGDETEMWGESAYTSHGETKVEKARGGGESTNENARGTIHGKNSNGRATV